jgi:hypothetical protein
VTAARPAPHPRCRLRLYLRAVCRPGAQKLIYAKLLWVDKTFGADSEMVALRQMLSTGWRWDMVLSAQPI